MVASGGFQTQVGQPASGVAGMRANMNMLVSYAAGPGALVSGDALYVGRFAWVSGALDPDNNASVANSYGSGLPSGFLMRAHQATNTTYLAYSNMKMLQGTQVDLQIAGDFWVVNDGLTEALVNQKAYADVSTGLISFAASGAPLTGASATASSIAASTFSVTGSISNDILTVTAVGTGPVVAGGTITGTGITSGSKILAQLSGTTGGVGTYRVSIPSQTAASTTVSGTYGTLTVGTVTTGNFAVGQQLNATGSVVAGTTVRQSLTGTGGTGSTFVVDNNTVVASQVISSGSNVETNFVARNAGAPGSLIKMSSYRNAGGQ